jgi:hypothetical protein
MKRYFVKLAALTAAVALVGVAPAAGPRGGGGGHGHSSGSGSGGRQMMSRGLASNWQGSHGMVGRYNLGRQTQFRSQLRSYRGRDQRHWSYCRWSGRYGCWLYYSAADSCYFYWCAQDGCYYPTDYCPYGGYDAGDDTNYAPRSVPVAEDDN